MHILFDSLGLSEYGASEVYKSFCLAHAASRYARVSVVMPERWVDQVPSLVAAGVNIVPVHYDNRQLPLNGPLQYGYQLYSKRALEAARGILDDVDVVHRVNPVAVRHASAIAFAGRPFIVGAIGWSRLPRAWAMGPAGAARNLLKTVDRIRTGVGITRLHRMYEAAGAITLEASTALQAFPPSLRQKCVVLGQWIRLEDYPAMPPPDNAVPVVLFVGRLIAYKGVEHLIDALSSIRTTPWQLRVVGSGPLEGALKERAAQSGVADRIEFIGHLSRDLVVEQYGEADICCFPGVNESFGNVNIEAMTCSRPVVVADWAGARDCVTDECGIRVTVGSRRKFTLGLRDALERLFADPGLRRRMGEAGRSRVETVYAERVLMLRYRQLYEKVAQGPAEGNAAAARCR
ncbi:MAG: glycosyltransferase family 4 protein [Armatimonadetes bacterium]|nr:glycosyltransferase family 4 protein [Armatimonadota bacterium]